MGTAHRLFPSFPFNGIKYLSCRVSPRRTRAFCYGKRTQNHLRSCVAPSAGLGTGLRVPCAATTNPSTAHRTGPGAAQLAEPVLSLAEGLGQCSPSFRIRHTGSATP